MGQFIDFKWVIAHTDVPAVLAGLECKISRQNGDEIRAHCPLHEDDSPSFSINVQTTKWKCFAGCGEGDAIELVAQKLNVDKRSAAAKIAEWSGCALADPNRGGRRGNTPRRQAKKPALKPEPDTPSKEWKPFATRLKLDQSHPFAKRFSPGLCTEFAMGFQDRGMMKDRWCIPIHDHNGEQLGYCGRHTADELDKKTPRWLFPEGFPKSEVLFNLHRVDHTQHQGIVLVEGCGDTIRMHDLSVPTAGTLGTSISVAQAELLASLGFTEAILLFDGDAEGQKAVPSAVAALAPYLFVRSVQLPEDHDPETVPVEFIKEHLWWL